jgi:hypothetical protein
MNKNSHAFYVLKMKKFFLIFILIPYSSSSQSNISLDVFDLEADYRKYLDNPKQKTWADFEDHVIERYGQNPLGYLKFLKRYHSDVFEDRSLLWISLKLTGQLFNPKFDLVNILRIIVYKIRYIIRYSDNTNELKFKKKLEIASLMIETVEKIYPKLKSRRTNNVLVSNIEDRIAIWKFLIENISIDFKNRTVYYDSLFGTFNEIRYIIVKNLYSEKVLRLSKLCSLLWYHLQHIYQDHDIFDSDHRDKLLIISLSKAVGCWLSDMDRIGEFNSNLLSTFLIKLYKDKNDLKHLNLIIEILENRMPNFERKHVTKVPMKVFFNFFELTRFFNDKLEEKYHYTAWNCKAYALFESYLKRNGHRISYHNIPLLSL